MANVWCVFDLKTEYLPQMNFDVALIQEATIANIASVDGFLFAQQTAQIVRILKIHRASRIRAVLLQHMPKAMGIVHGRAIAHRSIARTVLHTFVCTPFGLRRVWHIR